MADSIAIDGPVGAGKSSVAQDVASRLGLVHLDTGAMYRAFAWHALEKGLDTRDEAALSALAEGADIRVAFADGTQRTFVGDADVTDLIRTPRVSLAASDVSRFADVRAMMVRAQRRIAAETGMVLDGRDICTRVLPDAAVKVYLTAAPEIRARRRYLEMLGKGETAVYEDVLADVNRRDRQDMTREVEPLRPAEDAVVIDASDMTQKQAADAIIALWEAKRS